MAKTQSHILEQNQRLSDSMLWSAQRDYYHQQGIDAWTDEVPFYITSNPYIAHCYCKVILGCIHDLQHSKQIDASSPFYIVELGAGTGQFSFYMVKTLCDYLQQLKLKDVRICYVMTDFTENNMKYWQEHPALQDYVQQGVLDFAVFDFEHDQDLHLIHAKRHLHKEDITNPLFVIANYLFDTLTADAFAVKEGQLQESLITLSQSSKVNNKKGITDWDKVNVNFSNQSIAKTYYDDAVLDSILFDYQQEFSDTHFLYPIGGLRGLQNLLDISEGDLILISSDKGYVSIEQQDDCAEPEFDTHGSFSLMVNYHAIAEFFNRTDGDALLPTERDGLVTSVFSGKRKFDDYPRMQIALQEFIEGFSPTDFFNIYDNLTDTVEQSKLPLLTSLLTLSHWDPVMYQEMSDRIDDLIDDADPELTTYLSKYLPKVADNFYFLPKTHDVLFDIGVFYLNTEQHQHAMEYFLLSEQYFEPEFALYYNLGICCYYLEDLEQAKKYFNQAKKLDATADDLQEWLAKV